MGFDANNFDEDYEKLKEKVLDEMKKSFRPEFLNRINDIVLFRMLRKADMEKIIELELDKLRLRLAEKGMTIELDSDAIDFLISKGWDEKYGARPLKRAIERELEDALAEEILKGNLVESSQKIVVSLSDDSKKLVFKQKKSGGKGVCKKI